MHGNGTPVGSSKMLMGEAYIPRVGGGAQSSV